MCYPNFANVIERTPTSVGWFQKCKSTEIFLSVLRLVNFGTVWSAFEGAILRRPWH